MTLDIFEDKGNEGRVPSPPIPLSGEVEEVMPMGKSQGIGHCGEPELCVKQRGGEAQSAQYRRGK